MMKTTGSLAHFLALTAATATLYLFPHSAMTAPATSNLAPNTEASRTEIFDDIATLRARLTAWELSGGRPCPDSISCTPDEVAAWPDRMDASGRWPDIDYATRQRTHWTPAVHLERLRFLAIAFNTPGNPLHEKPAVLATILRGLESWFADTPVSDNWWWNRIGGPLPLVSTLQLLGERLPAPLRARAIASLQENPDMTGQNRVWISQVVIYRGLLENSPARIAAGVTGIEGTLHITTQEGIQCDGSFWQHGQQLYNGGYGLGFLSDTSRWAVMLRGTAFDFQPSSLQSLFILANTGTAWMARKGRVDPLVTGRELVRPRIDNRHATALAVGLGNIATLQAAAPASLVQGPAPASARHFWRGDYTVLHRPGFMTSLRTISTGRTGMEIVNSENLLGTYLPFGTTLIFRDGHEYDNLAPLWDWRQLPGTTTAQTPAIPRPPKGYLLAETHFSGGVSDGLNAHAALEQKHPLNPIAARKSWFFFDDGFVALIAGIHTNPPAPGDTTISTDALRTNIVPDPVFTTLNQTHLRGPVRLGRADGTRETIPAGTHAYPPTGVTPLWIHHDGVGYIPPAPSGPASPPATLRLKNAPATGNWHRVNSNLDDKPVTGNLFLLALDHGPAPAVVQPSSYFHYIILPGADETATAAFAHKPSITILANTPALQAARHTNEKTSTTLTGITFFEPGNLDLSPHLALSADAPCLILLRETTDGALTLSIAAPRPNDAPATLHLNLTRKIPDTTTHLTIDLPGGDMSGSTITQKIP